MLTVASNCCVDHNHPEGLLKHRLLVFPQRSQFNKSEVGSEILHSNKFQVMLML